jgi:branched-chain amino acid transport system substrate-binding protein
MKKLLAALFGVMLVAGLCPAAFAAEPIEIALLYPLTGPLADPGSRAKAACDVAAEVINGSYDLSGIPYAKTQGIPNKGGAKIVLKYYDTQGSPEVGKAETERILQEGKAKLIIGAYQSSVTKPTSAVTERQKFPYLCAESSSAALTERGYKYFFRIAPTDYHDTVMFFQFLEDMKKEGKKVAKIAMVYEKTEFGFHANEEVKKAVAASKGAYQVVADIPYEFKATNVNAEVLKVKAAQPDVVFHATQFSEMMLFAKAYESLGVNVPANLSFCGGYQNPVFAKELGKTVENYMGSCTFAEDFIAKKAQLKVLNDMFKAKVNSNLDGVAMEALTSVFVAADALNRAKDLSPQAVTDALAATEMQISTLPGKGVKFDKDGQNIWIDSTMSQVIGGDYKVVWPAEWSTSKVVWPMQTLKP